MKYQEHAFSTIELMATIAIMAILASISVAGLWGVRAGSRVSATEGLMETTRTGAVACLARGKALSNPVAKEYMCGTDGIRWPELPGAWVYDTPIVSDVSARTFSFSVNGDATTISCDQEKCSST